MMTTQEEQIMRTAIQQLTPAQQDQVRKNLENNDNLYSLGLVNNSCRELIYHLKRFAEPANPRD